MPRPSSHSSGSQNGSSTPTPSPLTRLPVNPRRKKVAPDERKRVATACNSCNVRRIKCSGERPCRQCTSSHRPCLYPEPVERVTIPRTDLEALRQRCAELERRLGEVEGDDRSPDAQQPRPSMLPQQVASPSASSRTDTADSLSLNGDPQHSRRQGGIDGRMLADPAGTRRYLGETSGATFLDSLKGLITTAMPLARMLNREAGEAQPEAAFLRSLGQYQTHDSRPMVLPPDADPMVLPPPAEIDDAISLARYFIQDANGTFPSGGIWFWPFEDQQSIIPPASLAVVQCPGTSALALYHAAFALTRLLNLREPGSFTDGNLGEEYFARARLLLGNLLDRTTYTINDIAVLALMALYFIENNRRDAAYMAISNAMTISVMHGIHKGVSIDERGVRTFWTVYVLDRWLSCVMGRPPTTPDDAITLPLPSDRPNEPLPPSDGLCAHVELCKISDYIVYSSYRESELSHLLTQATVRVDKALEMLHNWHANLPTSLRLPDPLTLLPADLFTQASGFQQGPAAMLSGAAEFGQDRACWALHMSYYQLIILAVRPAMLMAVQKAVASIVVIDQPFDIESHPSILPIRTCSDAARCNLRLGRLMRLHSPRQKLLLPDLHNIFNAAIILTMHQIVFVNLRTQDLEDVAWASEVFEAEAVTGNEYAKDCAGVLRDLKYLSQQLRNPIHDPQTKSLLLSDESVLLALQSADQAVAAEMMVDGGEGTAAAASAARVSPALQPNLTNPTFYRSVTATYDKLSDWWKADYMHFYNTYLS